MIKNFQCTYASPHIKNLHIFCLVTTVTYVKACEARVKARGAHLGKLVNMVR